MGSAPVIVLAACGVVFLVAFVVVERRAAEPVLPLRLFANRVFTVCSAVGFVVGFAMFGAITYLPQYMQVVKGASPTSSGLQLLPLMAGLLLTSMASGVLISRWGRYKVFPIVGTALMTVGMYLLSHLGVTTSTLAASAYMFVLARKQDRARVYERLAETASVNLDPRSTWMLFRLDGHPRLDLPALDAALDVTPGQLSTLLAPLIGAGFVTITPSPPESPLIAQLTPAGADAIERLVRARQQGLTRLLGSWSADLDAQLAARIQQLTRDILDDPARRDQLLAALAPAPTGTP